jgi:hypothetical protein
VLLLLLLLLLLLSIRVDDPHRYSIIQRWHDILRLHDSAFIRVINHLAFSKYDRSGSATTAHRRFDLAQRSRGTNVLASAVPEVEFLTKISGSLEVFIKGS